MSVVEGKELSSDILINDTISDDEVVASDVPPRYLFGGNRIDGGYSERN